MISRIEGVPGEGGGWKYAHGIANYGKNFAIKWLKVIATSTPLPPLSPATCIGVTPCLHTFIGHTSPVLAIIHPLSSLIFGLCGQMCELSFHKTASLKNPFNDHLPVKVSRDCQEVERTVAEQLLLLLASQPDSPLMVPPHSPSPHPPGML